MSERTPKRRGLRERLRKLRLFLTDPQGWSAEWYREKNTYDSVAVRQEYWREPRLDPPAEE